MKKTTLFLSALALVLLSACGNLDKPQEVVCNPNPLTVVGGKVNAEITGTFPAKKFPKKATLVVTPVLKYQGQEFVGTPMTYVGEKAKENGKTVNYKNGGRYTQKFTCDFVPEMNKAELFLRFEGKLGNKVIDIPEIKVADGVNATAEIVEAHDNLPKLTPDRFQRIIQETQEADIRFLINQATLRDSETKSAEVTELYAAILEAIANENKDIEDFEIAGYASPDGKEDHNAKLAKERQAVAQKFLQKKLKKDKVKLDIESEITAEDWEGFQALMEKSNIQDKSLVLRVLNMYSDPEEREAQIKNLAAVYTKIADEILPALRRSRLVLTIDIIGKSDAEIAELAKNDPAQLSVDELLYAASLTKNKDEQKAIYKKVIELYPQDARAYNNLGMIEFNDGNIAEARRLYVQALARDSHNPDINYNAALAAMADNDLVKAEEYLGKAAGTSADLNAAMGTFYTMKGEYGKATASYKGVATNNAAVQQILNENYAGARQTLEKVENPNATTAYLLAIVGARTNDRDAVYANLRSAIAQDNTLKAKAADDIEFAKFANDDTFLGIVK